VSNVFAKTVGGVRKLFVDMVSVPDQVAQWIKDRRFSERSIELFRNIKIGGKEFKNVLSKVALLGHEMPAVEGMSPITMALLADDTDYDQQDWHQQNYTYEIENKNNENLLTFTKLSKREDHSMPELKELQTTMADLQERMKGLEGKTDEQSKIEFAQLKKDMETFGSAMNEYVAIEKELRDENTKLSNSLEVATEKIKVFKSEDEKNKDEIRKKDIEKFIADLKGKGKVVPAFEHDLSKLLYSLDDTQTTVCYSVETNDGDVERKVTQLDFAKRIFDKLSKIVEYGEYAEQDTTKMDDEKTKAKVKTFSYQGNDIPIDGLDDEKAIEKYMKENKCDLATATEAVLDAKEKKE
jgi:hypothetical protein